MSTVTSERQGDTVIAGIGWMVLTTFCFVAVTGIVRYVGSDIPATQAAFIRYLIGVVIFLPFLRRILRQWPSASSLKIHVGRGVVHGVAVTLWFFAMARIPIAEVTALGYISPIFVAIGAAVFFGEKLHFRRITAIAVALLGALVILRPGFEEISIGQLAQVAAAPMFAISFLLAKKMTETEDTMVIVVMLSILCTIVLTPGALMNWSAPSAVEVFWLAMTAVFATIGHYTMTRAFRAAPLTVTQPVGILQLVWAALLGIVAFGEPVDPFVILGGGIVVAAATFISHREAIAAQAIKTPPAPATKD
ncbi:MAG: DMT family transporter [Rhizobiaceae bacterium]